MKNWEKYEDSIRDTKGCFGVTAEGKLIRCYSLKCEKCIFTDCVMGRLNWLYSEYEPPKPKLTAQDKAFLDCIESNPAYIARDKSGSLFCYLCKPTKYETDWYPNGADCFEFNRHFFKFITWDDEKPWLLLDLKKLEVEE